MNTPSLCALRCQQNICAHSDGRWLFRVASARCYWKGLLHPGREHLAMYTAMAAVAATGSDGELTGCAGGVLLPEAGLGPEHALELIGLADVEVASAVRGLQACEQAGCS